MKNNHDDGNVVGSFLAGLGIGALVGAAVAMLMAPKSGSETREDIIHAVDEAKLKASGMANDLSESGEELLEKSKELMETTKEKMQAAIDAGKDVAMRKKEEFMKSAENEE